MLEKTKLRDRKAPRFRRSKYRYTILNQHLHYNYLKENPEGIKDYSIYKNLIEDFNLLLGDEVVKNRDGVKLPMLMGILALCSFKPKRVLPLRWSDVGEHALKIKEMNIDTNGLACKIVYSMYGSKYKFAGSHMWRFEGHRDFKAKVSKAFRANYTTYKRMDNKFRVSKMFKDDYSISDFFPKRDEQRVDDGHKDN
jgi:hypothetical protein